MTLQKLIEKYRAAADWSNDPIAQQLLEELEALATASPAPMNKQLLQQLEALAPLAAAATEGPWKRRPDWCPQDITVRDTRPLHDDDELRIATQPREYLTAGNWAANAAFIVAARNLLTPETIAALVADAALAAPQWVPVSERLPEANEGGHFSEDVLMHFEGLAPTVGYYDYRDGYKEFQSYDDSYSGYGPSHWQAITRPAATPQQESHE